MKAKPLVFGKIEGVSPVNPSAPLIYRIHRGKAASVDGVYEHGIPKTVVEYNAGHHTLTVHTVH